MSSGYPFSGWDGRHSIGLFRTVEYSDGVFLCCDGGVLVSGECVFCVGEDDSGEGLWGLSASGGSGCGSTVGSGCGVLVTDDDRGVIGEDDLDGVPVEVEVVDVRDSGMVDGGQEPGEFLVLPVVQGGDGSHCLVFL